MIEKIPEPIPDLPDDPDRRQAKDEFLDAFIDLGCWERDGYDGRNALALLGQLIAVCVDAESIKRLSARIRYFIDNEGARRDFDASLGEDVFVFRENNHGNEISDAVR